MTTVTAHAKSREISLALLGKLHRVHPTALRVHLILDKSGIHLSARARRCLVPTPVFVLYFLPPYTPDVHRIGRMWREVAAHVTRNHRSASVDPLLRKLTWDLVPEDRRRRRAVVTINNSRRKAA